ncbi:MAG: LysR family transcriptional regulator [Caulobacteraceae bacterium]
MIDPSKPDIHTRAAAISFRQLKLFESIGRLKSVRRASEECALSQPAVTQALAKLEQQVGAQLVDRRARGSYLNEAGEKFYARVARFFDQAEQALIELGVPGGPNAIEVVAKRLSRSQMRALIAIVEAGSFAGGADALGLSHASLQRAARDLEGNLRKPIFYRTASGTMVTPAGYELGRKMKLAAQEIEWGIRELEAASGGFSSQIVIGAMPFGGSVLIASALDEFLRSYPQADIRIVSENAAEILRRLRMGDADFVIGLLPETPADDLVTQAFAPTPYSIVGRRGHPLMSKGRVTVEDLLPFDWVAGNAGSSRRACFDNLFAGRTGPQPSVLTCALPVIRNLLTRSDRLTLMTSYELMHEQEGLSALLFGPIMPVPQIGVTLRADWKPTALHDEFIAIIRRHMGAASLRPNLREVS